VVRPIPKSGDGVILVEKMMPSGVLIGSPPAKGLPPGAV
jgi:hypothetical protein